MKISNEGSQTVIDGVGTIHFHLAKDGIQLEEVSNFTLKNFYLCHLTGSRISMAARAFIVVWKFTKGIKGKTE